MSDQPSSRHESGEESKRPKLRPAAALRDVFKEGYNKKKLRDDILAGLVVGIVALPLSMALAIASGVPPQHGLYTAIVAGFVIAALGGSRTQISGPTAAFVVILAPVSAKFGIGGLLVASLMAGLILVSLAIARLGKLIQYIPYPVTAGFTAGIAIVIATLQLKDFFGLKVVFQSEHYPDRVKALALAAPTFKVGSVLVGAVTLAVLLLWPKVTKKLPAPLVALGIGAGFAALLAKLDPSLAVDTIGSRFSYVVDGVTKPGIPQLPPLPVLPWHLPGADGKPLVLSYDLLEQLAPSASAIAMLGAIESLLSAVVADGLANTKHDPDAELFGQGIGNILAPFFGGFAATGAIARTATNIRAGAQSPISSIVHAAFVLLAVLALAPLVSYLPMPALAALLLLVAWNMSDIKHVIHILKVAPKSDVFVLLTCLSLTVIFDMVVSVSAGVMLASLLFMRRMAEISGARVADEEHPAFREVLPKGVVLYRIEGALFFGAAAKAMDEVELVGGHVRAIILDLSNVPVMDATGLVALETAIERLKKNESLVILAGVQAQPKKVLVKAKIEPKEGEIVFADTLRAGIAHARKHVGEDIPAAPASETPLSAWGRGR
ncbi:MAG: C4-dicarboxylic acid transporter DauA [Polyangiaceae bacterium]|nr:C4-dicarboxylic acid transporter DauA [Polyangiaceae bacterium]